MAGCPHDTQPVTLEQCEGTSGTRLVSQGSRVYIPHSFPGSPAEARQSIFLFLGWKFCGQFGGNISGNDILRDFSAPQNQAQKSRRNFRSMFCEKIRASEKKYVVPTSFCRRATLTHSSFFERYAGPRYGTTILPGPLALAEIGDRMVH